MDWLLFVLRLLAVAVLYGFLAIAVYVIWLDMRTRNEGRFGLFPSEDSVSTIVIPPANLVIAERRVATDESAGAFRLTSQTSIGRAEDNDIVCADDCVSSHHAQVVYRDGYWWLHDLASRNGTSLNGEAIESAAVLRHGDVVGVGSVALTLDLNPDA